MEHANDALKADKDFILSIIDVYGPDVLSVTNSTLKADKDFMLADVRKSGQALQHADVALTKEKEIAIVTIKQSIYTLKLEYRDLLKDRDCMPTTAKHSDYEMLCADSALQ